MAIVKGIQAFKYYLYNRKFIILSDSAPLRYYRKTSSPTDLTTRWLLKIGEYNGEFQHVPGKQNLLADYFSRVSEPLPKQDIRSNPELLTTKDILPCEELNHLQANVTENTRTEILPTNNTNNCNQSKDPLLEVSNKTFLTEQLNDPNIVKIRQAISQNSQLPEFKNYFICPYNNLLYINIIQNNQQCVFAAKIVVPNSLIPKILRIGHVGHLGVTKTYQLLQRRYFSKGMQRDTKQYVDSCAVCLQVKPQRVPQAPFQRNFIPTHPGEMISMDIVGPLKNKMYVLTIIDIFSRHMELFPLKNITASNVADKLLRYISSYGRPAQVLTDLGTQFTSDIFQNINQLLQINLIHTSSGHPQANGISERINTSIKATIKALQMEGHSFMHAIDLHKSIYNASLHPATGFSPNHIHFARELSLFTDTLNLEVKPLNVVSNHKLFEIYQAVEKVHQMVYGNLQYAQQCNIDRQKQSKKLRQFKPGDYVYIRDIGALQRKLDGPFKVLYRTSAVNYKVQRVGNPAYKKFIIHVDRLVFSRQRPPRLMEQDKLQHTKSVNNSTNLCFSELSFQEIPVSSTHDSSIDPFGYEIGDGEVIRGSEEDRRRSDTSSNEQQPVDIDKDLNDSTTEPTNEKLVDDTISNSTGDACVSNDDQCSTAPPNKDVANVDSTTNVSVSSSCAKDKHSYNLRSKTR